LLVVSASGNHPLAVSPLAAGIPVRYVGRPDPAIRAAYIDADNRDGARQAVEHLLLGGRRMIATIAGPPDRAACDDRLLGYRQTLEAAGVPPLPIAYGDFTHASGDHAMTWLLQRAPRLDAVFVASDLMAAGALQALRRTGRRVPQDVAVVGFDDSPIASHTSPPLTTVRQPVEAVGELAVELLLSTVDGENPVLPTELVVRAST
jgi:DNA-binding LacI/PurR family transcriptional regulator